MYSYNRITAIITVTTIITSIYNQLVTNSSTIKSPSLIAIKGHSKAQSLPQSLVINWKSWTFDSTSDTLIPVENDEDEGWVNPTSFNQLFLPSDLPLPKVIVAIVIIIYIVIVLFNYLIIIVIIIVSILAIAVIVIIIIIILLLLFLLHYYYYYYYHNYYSLIFIITV